MKLRIFDLNRRSAFTALAALLLWTASSLSGDDWPQWMGPKNDGVWRETGIVKSLANLSPNYKWRIPINKGYTGPAVVEGRVYVMDRVEG